jgi:very-short-patch-repair endonuclease
MSILTEDPVDIRIERWRKSLVDTSLRNRLMDVKESRLGCLRLTSPMPQDIYRTLVEAKGSFFVEIGPNGSATCSSREATISPRPLEGGRGDRSLMLLRSKAREALREQGVNILYLTIGMLEWSGEGTQGQTVRSPLVLVPVELSRSSPLDPYVLRVAGEVTGNPTLAHKLRSELALVLPSLPEGAFDPAAYLDSVARAFQRLGWEVKDTSYLGLFKFPKMCMYDELGQQRAAVAAHPVIRALAGEAPEQEAAGIEMAGREDRDDFQVLDADSSQQEAVSLALSGSSFVLQGPPGTGKSQTIANIIAESISRGRTVLFVSEKLAALEVVKKRLDASGLGDYCLELHDYASSSQVVMDELSRCLSAPPKTEPLPSEREELERVRADLDDYVDALHQKRDGLGISFRELLSELTALRSAPDLPLGFPNLDRMAWKDIMPLHPLVRDVERYAPVLSSGIAHPWSDCLVDSWKLSSQTEIAHRLSALKLAISRLKDATEQFCRSLDLEVPNSLKGVNDLIAHLRTVNLTAYPEEKWLTSDPTPLFKLLDDTRSSYQELGDRMAWLRQKYREDVLALDLRSMQNRFDIDHQSALRRTFSLGYRRDMGTLRSLNRGTRKLNFDTAKEELGEIAQISDLVTGLHALETECGERLGKHFQGENTDWDKVKGAIAWTKDYFDQYGTPTSPGIIRLLCSGPDVLVGLKTMVDELQDVAMRMEGAVSAITERFIMSRLASGRTVHEIPFDELTTWAQGHMEAMSRFQEWAEASRVRKEAGERGLGDLLALATQGSLPDHGIWDGVRKRYLTLWHDLLLSRDHRLRDFDHETHERAITRFVELDRLNIDQAASRARAALDARRAEMCDLSTPEMGSGMWVLKHEVSRKKNLRPVRELFSQASEPIQALKPCLLMSPLSVSTFLDPAKVRFDLVIFDEASQVRPEDAIGSIMRAKQVIVVGDNKQLPPTDFFLETSAEEEDVPDLESILDECSSAMPQRMLLWHYRSRQESLISFSNRRFYGGRLITFPSASVDRDGLGVSFVHVADGAYDRARSRRNAREAEKVAELVAEHVTGGSGDSLGVVAFSEAQQMAIIEELEKLTSKRPGLAPLLSDEGEEGFFVKNLENVQGDERDVMIFSVGYGKDSQGKMYQNFGPLNKAGGERRLNVAITRARKHIKLVSSILPEDIEGTTPGAEALREYIAYAMTHELTDAGSAREEEQDRLQAEIRSWLESRGLLVEERVGRSVSRIDLAVADRNRPGNYVLGILTDGRSYRKAGNARDRERLREEVLTGLGWYIHRVWSQEWIRDRDREGERILAALDRARAAAAEKALREQERKIPEVLVATCDELPAAQDLDITADSPSIGPEVVGAANAVPAEVAVAAVLPMSEMPAMASSMENDASMPAQKELPPTGAELPEGPGDGEAKQVLTAERDRCALYRKADLIGTRSLVESYRSDPSRTLIEAAEIVVGIEGPVHISVVKDRIRDLVTASTGKRPSNLDKVIKQTAAALERYGKVRVDGEFLWPSAKNEVPPRKCEGFRRNVDHVCDAEMEATVFSLVPTDRPVNLRDLVSGVSALLGYKRPTPAIRSRVERAVEALSSKDTAVSEEEPEAKCPAPKDDAPTSEQACP